MATQSDINKSQDQQDVGIRKEFRNVHRIMDQRFDEQRSYMDGRFSSIDERFARIDERFGENEAFSTNCMANSSWHDISPIGVFDISEGPSGRYRKPVDFPNKVAKFWHLQRSRNRKKHV